jgi:hypothetical protein
VIHFFWDRILGTYRRADCCINSDKLNSSEADLSLG